MSDLWNRIQALEGKTLQTRSRGNSFKIIQIVGDKVYFMPVSGNGTLRWVNRQPFEYLENLRLNDSELTPSRIAQEFPEDRNTSYIAAILHVARN